MILKCQGQVWGGRGMQESGWCVNAGNTDAELLWRRQWAVTLPLSREGGPQWSIQAANELQSSMHHPSPFPLGEFQGG